jgi:hypothetical protein
VDRAPVIDLYTIRCAVAVLVHARRHHHQLQRAGIDRVDDAVTHLAHVARHLHGDLAAALRELLDPGIDPAGQRTVRAIDRLATLTHVDDDTAPALAASLHPISQPIQTTLFGLDTSSFDLHPDPA